MKQLNLKEYLEHPEREVVTKDGLPVRIICTDVRGDCPIVGLVDRGYGEGVYEYTEDGCYNGINCAVNLFFKPVKHEGWVNIYSIHSLHTGGAMYDSKEEAERMSGAGFVAIGRVEWEE